MTISYHMLSSITIITYSIVTIIFWSCLKIICEKIHDEKRRGPGEDQDILWDQHRCRHTSLVPRMADGWFWVMPGMPHGHIPQSTFLEIVFFNILHMSPIFIFFNDPKLMVSPYLNPSHLGTGWQACLVGVVPTNQFFDPTSMSWIPDVKIIKPSAPLDSFQQFSLWFSHHTLW